MTDFALTLTYAGLSLLRLAVIVSGVHMRRPA